eukprot:SAG11_NODE_10489_length_828_cov_0.853224_1_plen_154_part_01
MWWPRCSTLGRRLLNDTTVGIEQENQFLTMIKQRCGANYTRQQEGMINDIRASDTKHTLKFEEYRASNESCATFAGVKVGVRLLNAQVWPAFGVSNLVATGQLGFIKDAFDSYFAGAKPAGSTVDLSWLFTEGNVSERELLPWLACCGAAAGLS